MPSYSIQFRRGTATDHSSFTGELAEITIDITNNRVVLHDGATPGGIPLAKVTDLPIDVGDLSDNLAHIAAANTPAAAPLGAGDRAVTSGGSWQPSGVATYFDIVDYHSISTGGAASNFGNLTNNVWRSSGCSNETYGLVQHGFDYVSSNVSSNAISYMTIATLGSIVDFGNLLVATANKAALSDGTYGIFGGNNGTTIEYVIIDTPGTAQVFGNLLSSKDEMGGLSDGTYGIFGGGSGDNTDIMYIITATTGDASDFGDLLYNASNTPGTAADTTRGLFAGGGGGLQQTINYITIATPGQATDFGDLSPTATMRYSSGGGTDNTYATFAGGYYNGFNGNASNVIHKVTIQTAGNATDHGDLTQSRFGCCTFAGADS